MIKERRNVILFLDNATVLQLHSLTCIVNMKIVFLPKNTLHWQPLDAGIIRSFKMKYRQKLIRYVIAHANDNLFASDTAKSIDILQATLWVADAWKEASVETIKNCLAKCGITEQTS